MDEVAEWLRRWTAKPLCSALVNSNLILVEGNILLSVLLPGSYKIIKRMKNCFHFYLCTITLTVLWCNWSALRTLNPVIRVQVSVEPFIVSLYSIRLRDGRLSALMKMKLLPGVLLSINYFAFRTRFNESDGVSLNQ